MSFQVGALGCHWTLDAILFLCISILIFSCASMCYLVISLGLKRKKNINNLYVGLSLKVNLGESVAPARLCCWSAGRDQGAAL